ncbi:MULTISPECIES: hypothetical protein [Chitinophagaceae]
MRKIFALLALLGFAVVTVDAQVIARRTPTVYGRNLLDANKNYKLAPINFVPFTFRKGLIDSGYTADRIYKWKMPDGTEKTASGAAILKEVNAMEQELNKRGHTLRNRSTFNNVNFDFGKLRGVPRIPKTFPKSKPPVLTSRKIPTYIDLSRRVKLIPSADLSQYIPGDVYIYFGALSRSTEFPGVLSTTTHIDNVKNPTSCPLDLTIAMDGSKLSSLNITNGILELSSNPNRKPNDKDGVIASTTFNFKNPALTLGSPSSSLNISGERPPSFYQLYYFPLTLQDLSKKMPAAKKSATPENYYAYVKFYNANNELLYYSSYNTAIVGNVQDPPLTFPVNRSASGSFEDAYTDPTGLFGIYYKGENIKAQYTLLPDGWNPTQEAASLSARVEIGAQYYNFGHLLDNDQPKTTRQPFISADVTAQYTQIYNPAAPPRIRIPGKTDNKSNDMNGYGGYTFDYTLLSNRYGKSSPTAQSNQVGMAILPKQQFFIGPVPCFIQVDLTGTASINRTATMDTLTDGKVGLRAQFTPHLDLTVTGQGGVDATIAYAKIVANVNVINADMPVLLAADQNADIQTDLKINALSGRVYLEAGICVPIPFFDDVCKRFTVDIFNWTGPGKTYPIIK